jgi:hypothetical protein
VRVVPRFRTTVATRRFHSSRIFRGTIPPPACRNFAAKRRKTTPFKGINQWLAWPKYFGISGPFCSPTGSNPVGDANLINNLQLPSRIL